MPISVDDHVVNLVEISSNALRVSEMLLLKMLQALLHKLENKDRLDDVVISKMTKDGKQKIKDLKEKHKGDIESLDDNIPKGKIKFYENEFKKFGVDFSVAKNENDSYSIVFASKDIALVEKALKNITESEIEKQHETQKDLDLDNDGTIDHADIDPLDNEKQRPGQYDLDVDGSIDKQDLDDKRPDIQTTKDKDKDFDKFSKEEIIDKSVLKSIDMSYVKDISKEALRKQEEKTLDKEKSIKQSREER
ncbi:hypothetical protein HO429_09960 [Streptococcus suis]|nr:hypothetical protein [Streptococcus suis]HEM4142596.1 hypothetical protein [Streptococcus suis]